MEVAAQRTRLQELRSCARSGMARIDLTYAARATNRHSIRGRKTARYQRVEAKPSPKPKPKPPTVAELAAAAAAAKANLPSPPPADAWPIDNRPKYKVPLFRRSVGGDGAGLNFLAGVRARGWSRS